jgi:hypothetical protein
MNLCVCRRIGCVLSLVAAGVLAPALSSAQQTATDRETARTLMDKGDTALGRGDAAEALRSYEAAHAIMNVPTTGLAVAQAQVALGKLVEARDTALAVARLSRAPREAAAFAKARADAERLAEGLAPRIPSLTVTIEMTPPGDAQVRIDGDPLVKAGLGIPRKVNPGRHVVTAEAQGYREARAEVELAEGASESIVLRLERLERAPAPTAAAPASPPREPDAPEPATTSPLVYVGFGVGAVGIAVGSITGFMSLSKTSSVKSSCTDGVCPPAKEDDLSSAKTLANISNVGFAVGLVGIGLGVYGLMSSPSEKEPQARSARIEPVVGSRFIGARGTF